MCLEADFSHSADTRSPAPHTHTQSKTEDPFTVMSNLCFKRIMRLLLDLDL